MEGRGTADELILGSGSGSILGGASLRICSTPATHALVAGPCSACLGFGFGFGFGLGLGLG